MQQLCPDKLSELRNRSEAPQAAPALAAWAMEALPKSDRNCHKATRPRRIVLAASTAWLRALQAVLRKTAPETRTGATNTPLPAAAGASVARYREIPSRDPARRHGQCTGQGDPSRWARQRSRQRFPARVAFRPEPHSCSQYRQCGRVRRGRPPMRIQGFATDDVQGVSVLVAQPSIRGAFGLAGAAVRRCGRKSRGAAGFRYEIKAIRDRSRLHLYASTAAATPLFPSCNDRKNAAFIRAARRSRCSHFSFVDFSTSPAAAASPRPIEGSPAVFASEWTGPTPYRMDQTVIARTQDRSATAHAGRQHAGQPARPGTAQGKRMAKRVIEASAAAAVWPTRFPRRTGMSPA